MKEKIPHIPKFWLLLALVSSLFVTLGLYDADRIPAQSFIYAPEKLTDEKLFEVEWLQPKQYLIQRVTRLNHDTYSVRFWLTSEAIAAKDQIRLFVASEKQRRIISGYTMDATAIPRWWQEVRLQFPPLDETDTIYVVIMAGAKNAGKIGVKLSDPKVNWHANGQLWHGESGALTLMTNTFLWRLEGGCFISTRELIMRASQYGVIKGRWLLLLFWGMALTLLALVSSLGRITRSQRHVFAWFVITLAVGYWYFHTAATLQKIPTRIALDQKDPSRDYCENLLHVSFWGNQSNPPQRIEDVDISVGGSFDGAGHYPITTLAKEGIHGWLKLNTLPIGGQLCVNGVPVSPIQIGLPHQPEGKGLAGYLGFSAKIDPDYLVDEKVNLGVIIESTPGVFYRACEKQIGIDGMRLKEVGDFLRKLTPVVVKKSQHPGWIPLGGDWGGGGGAFGLGYFDRTGGVFARYDSAGRPLPEKRIEVKGEDLWPIAGDWTGEGRDGVGVYQASKRRFLLWDAENDEPREIKPVISGTLTKPVWRPFAGDWNGDGKTDVGLFDLTSKTVFTFKDDGTVITQFKWGSQKIEYLLLAGDWLGTGKYSTALLQCMSNTYYFRFPEDYCLPQRSHAVNLPDDAYPVSGRWTAGSKMFGIIYIQGAGVSYLK